MAIGINPTVDFAFKRMLGSSEHSNVTIHFLNSILGGRPLITEIQFLNTVLEKDSESDKTSVLDILAVDEHGRRVNIEIQTSLPAGLPQRLIYYTSCIYVGQLKEGARHTELRPAIGICVLTRPLFRELPDLHLDFRLRETSGAIFTDDLQIHLLELSKLKVTAQDVYHATPIERWAYFLRNAEQLNVDEITRLFPDREIAEAAGVLEMISQTPDQRWLYNARLKAQLDAAARIELASGEARKEGHQEGHQEGLQVGLQVGRQEGLQRGELIGRIKLCREFLVAPPLTREELEELGLLDLSQLNEQVESLQQQLRTR